MLRRWCRLSLSILLLGWAFAAYAAPEQSKIRLAVGGKTTLYYLPLTIAEQLSYFKDEGLEVEISDFPGGAKSLQALIGGSAQALTNAIVRALKWLQHATPEQVADTVPPEYLLGDRQLYIDAFRRVRVTFSPDGVIADKAIKQSYEVLLKHNPAVRRAPVLFLNDTYTNTFVLQANKQYP